MVLSLVIITAPAFAAETATPPDNEYYMYNPVPQGGLFLLRGSITFDDPANPGEFVWGPVGWYHNGNADENFCLENTPSVYWSDMTPVENVSITESEYATSHAVDIRDNGSKIERDGTFYIDIWLRAMSGDGTLHKVDNQWISFAMDYITLFEPGMTLVNAPPIYVDVVAAGVTVDISPTSQEDWAKENLNYTVTVTNTGASPDNYTLENVDDLGWTMSLTPDTLSIDNGDNKTATLIVTVGSCGGCTNNIKVTADGVYADNSDNCQAIQKTGPNVDVEILPLKYQSDLPGENLTYTVRITNIGTVPDNYTVSVMDDAVPSWGPHFSTATIYPTDDSHVAENCPDTVANSGTDYNMYVGWEGSPYCAGATGWDTRAYLRFDISSIPSGATINSATLNAKVQYGPSTGYDLYIKDNMLTDVKAVSGDSWLENELTWNNAPAVGSTLDTTMVLSDPPLYVWYSWNVKGFVENELAGDGVVSLCLMSENKEADNTDCTVWFYTKDASGTGNDPYLLVDYTYIPPGGFIVSLGAGENVENTLIVPIPIDAVPCTVDNVTVTAVSEENENVSDSDTCQAHAKAAVGMALSPISPAWQENCLGKPLQYCVTITNTGTATDEYDVVLSDNSGWGPAWKKVVQLIPIEDTHVIEGHPDTVQYDGLPGQKYNCYTGWDNQEYLSERAYFKFDLSSIPAGSEILGATLRLYNKYSPSIGEYPYTPCDITIEARKVNDDGWSEGTLTWNIAQASHPIDDIIDTQTILSTDGYHWEHWDVTSWVKYQWAVDKLVSIAMRSQAEDTHTDCVVWWYVKDAYPTDPRANLEVIYWDPLNTDIQVSIPAEENTTLCFKVIVPPNAIPCTEDEITVTATSKTDNTVTDSQTCIAHARSLRCVEIVSIEPPELEGYKDPLTFIVKIHNCGQLVDKYNLMAYDSLGWPLHIEPQEIWLKPCHEAQAALSVTIPCQTPGSTWDQITVVVEGKLASGTFTDPVNVRAQATCKVHVMEVLGVDVEVYPSIHQTGHPGSELVWLVTVTNTGNVTDTYDLYLSQYVYDKTEKSPYDNWVGEEFSQDNVQLGPGEEASIILSLRVSDDLRTCVQNEIDVEVVSRTDSENIRDNERVEAQVLELKPRIPQGEILMQVAAGIVAIDLWPTEYEFGVLNEMEEDWTPENYFTIRNVGNVDVEVKIAGTDAISKPGEPAAKWTLGDNFIGVDTYAMWWTPPMIPVTKDPKTLIDNLETHDEFYFDLHIQAPSTFTTPAKMWMKVVLTAGKIRD